MTHEEAFDLLTQYSEFCKMEVKSFVVHPLCDHIAGMAVRFDGSTDKLMRWLGWTQGVLVTLEVFTLEEVKEHSRTKKIQL